MKNFIFLRVMEFYLSLTQSPLKTLFFDLTVSQSQGDGAKINVISSDSQFNLHVKCAMLYFTMPS